jgi:hypothetical protein
VAYLSGSAGSPLIGSRLLLRTLSYDDLPSGSTGKPQNCHLGVGSADCQRFSFLCDFSVVPAWCLTRRISNFCFGSPHRIWFRPGRGGSEVEGGDLPDWIPSYLVSPRSGVQEGGGRDAWLVPMEPLVSTDGPKKNT